LNIINNDLL
jgi:hypothetical protein